MPAAASASKGGKLIALTFDDGPGRDTNRLLDGLAERGVKVTFFMLGQCAENYPETVRRVFREGHQLAQHTYDHPTLSTKSDDEVRWELNKTDKILNGHLGLELSYLLRPPYGDYNSHTLTLINRPAIIWSVDPLDWKYRNAQTVRKNIVADAFDGAVVLVHDIHATSVDGALMAIDDLLDEGYEFVTVNELFRRRGVSLNNGSTYHSCKPTGTDLGPVQKPVVAVKAVYGGYRVSLSAPSGAKVYYTTDGSDPMLGGKLYTDSLPMTQGQSIKAVAAYNRNGSCSAVLTQTMPTVALSDLSIRVENGKIVFSNPNENTDIRFTTDGSLPGAASTCYAAPLPCGDGVVRYRIMGDGVNSGVQTIYCTQRGNLFFDVPNTAWYFHNVDEAVTLGLFKGTDLYRFSPEESVTRGMFVTVLYRLAKQGGFDTAVSGTAVFNDVRTGAYYTDAVTWAAKNDIVRGYENNTFRPERSISREEMCVMLERALQAFSYPLTRGDITYRDKDEIAGWAYESVEKLSSLDIIRGDQNHDFAPSDLATRAQSATVFLRLRTLLEKKQ